MTCKRLVTHIKNRARKILGRLIIKRPPLNDCVLITNNCLGGFLYHDWNMKFQSPTINLQMDEETFLLFVESFPLSLDWKIKEVSIDNSVFYEAFGRDTVPFPVGEFIGGGRIYFQHYKNFSEAINAWERRSIRLKKRLLQDDNVNIILTCKNPNKQIIEKFKSLQYKKKLLLIQDTQGKNYDGYGDVFVMSNMSKDQFWYGYQNGISLKRYYEQFDFYKWVW